MDFTLDKRNANELDKKKPAEISPKSAQESYMCSMQYSAVAKSMPELQNAATFTLTCFKYFIICSENE